MLGEDNPISHFVSALIHLTAAQALTSSFLWDNKGGIIVVVHCKKLS
jgi:hypothetical protein